MATSFYFNNFGASQEQLLIENLVVESIKIYGHDTYYLPRTRVVDDLIYGEESYSKFDTQYFVEMYIKNVEGFAGQGDFLSKFNLEIRDQVTLTIARRAFFDEVGAYTSFERPREGDIIYFPLNKKLFEIKFVEHEAIFYQLGALQTFDLVCELFEYNNEIFNTGIDEIDSKQKTLTFNLQDFVLKLESGLALTDEEGYDLVQENFSLDTQDPISDNTDIQSESDDILDFTERDPFSEGDY
jgi:Virus neck protein